MDPPEQLALREVFTAACRAQRAEVLATAVRRFASAILTNLAARPVADLLADYFKPVALYAICELVGIPATQRAVVAESAETMAASMDGVLDPERRAAAIGSRTALSRVVDSCLRSSDGSGVLGHVARNHRRLDVPRSVLVHSFRLLLSPGYMSVATAAANAFVALRAHNLPLTCLSRDTGVDELLRYCGPVQALGRLCRSDFDFRGTPVRKGELVLALLGAANRDPERFPGADDIRLDRRPNPHLAFGWGTHSCLGTSTARLVLSAAFGRLADQFPAAELVSEPRYAVRAVVRAPEALPVRLTRGSEGAIR
ncbi:cytochrome P450 [Amycolatopsis samaneae]|uniref:Cytochrome P450 n=1 Tax=Amycolatopsis samaneae TaxID=664691 RepID=A0ABW5G750_9PSEU